MPTEIVEGYTASQQAAAPVPGASSSADMAWIAGLRQELRREMIRELALKRIRSGGRDNQPAEPSRLGRMTEAFFVGVAVTLVTSWVCSRASEGRS